MKNIHEINLFIPAKAALLLAHGHCRSPILSHQLFVNLGNWEYIIYVLWHSHHWSHTVIYSFTKDVASIKTTKMKRAFVRDTQRHTFPKNLLLHQPQDETRTLQNVALYHLWCLLSGWFSISHLIFCWNLHRIPSNLFKKYCLKIPNIY